jgi:SAM-dependent methyltransferase
MVDADEKAVLFELADIRKGDRVLDIGCGDGNYTVPAAQRSGWAVGIDPSVAMLKAAQRRPQVAGSVEYVEATGEQLPFVDDSFDIVLMVTVLCFVGNPEALLSEAYRVLRSGGRLVVGELGARSTWAFLRKIRGMLGDPTWNQARFYSRKELEALLSSAGFETVIVRGSVLYPPVHSASILRIIHPVETVGRRVCPWGGALLVARGVKPSLVC